ncbi:GGDEF domain-containing protein [Peribacillus cavernae]|uniref:GGDEF domain-containing protein n=1 Tax=Peribacillus cavernae TaxID=1674310 RepID=A0A3S0VGX5_9BACI|nr:sensor domain-containing diguanylate cyclase [Peribacillus cavernae]MDQ0219383.1 diguanylate cyclase (GGDEF)-like protein [Peribacillus cavernae]RUQ27741.1 GGDEF domain-containing protein [Peribacillus cavernae]
MEVAKHKRITVWLLWLLLVPAGITLTYQYYPPQTNVHGWDIIGFLFLACLLSLIPMMINNSPVSAVQGVSLAVFLIYGLAVEMIVTQITYMFMLLALRLRRNEIHRLPLNSLLFFFVSLVSGLIYYALAAADDFGTIVSPSHLSIIIVYHLIYFTLNTILVSVIRYLLYNQKLALITRDAVWDCIAALVVLPIGIILFILYQQLGYQSILITGIPLIVLAYTMKLYNSSQAINEGLQKASEFGHQLTQRLEVKEVIHLFVVKIATILPSEQTYILDVFNQEKEIHLLRYAEWGIEKEKKIKPLVLNEGISGHVWKTKKGIIYQTRKDWEHLDTGILKETVESVLAVPVVRNSLVVGVLILTSGKKRAYEQYQLMIMDILCSYLGAAIENARHLQETKQKSERCALTNLYNFRYFESALEKEFDKLQNKEYSNLSLIILDIDRFKSINDTYGHQSGNEILTELARRLERLMANRGILARFGGEEFVILMPEVDKAEAYDFAEFIRHSIASKPFSVHSDLGEHRSKLLVSVTASIGVASALADAEDAQSLVRHADRAMYTGAKQAGRNKVAQYVG